jgi:arylsulfatase A-like enzyme
MYQLQNKFSVDSWIKFSIITLLLTALTACGGSSSQATPPETSTPINYAPTGTITIVGTAVVGETLTIEQTIQDQNGLGEFNYQWQRQQANQITDISGANEASYQVTDQDIGSQLLVTIRYIDQDNFAESLQSEPTAVVTASLAQDQPNILLIIADDQGLDASAQYSLSDDVPNTPTLNALAANGLVFDNAWATPACTTTRGTIITGQHGIHSGISYVPAVMDPTTQTLQRYLTSLPATSNYQTAVIGKWHLGGAKPDLSHPIESGVGYYAGTISGTLTDYYQWELTENGQTQISNEYHTSKITDLAINWLATQNQQNKPWFLWLAYVAPHAPFHLPPANLHHRDYLTGTTADIAANPREYYLAAIEAMDTEIGRLLDSLPANERENTLIIYIGDNGTPTQVIDTRVFARDHSKNSLYEGGIRIPMVVSGKGVTRKNERESALINTTDLFATIINFTTGSLTQLNDSYSFLPLLSSATAQGRMYNYAEFESSKVTEPTGWVVRNQQYKYLELADGTKALYDMSNDINETTNLLETNSNTTAIVNELRQYGLTLRGEQSTAAIDITNAIFTARQSNCADFVQQVSGNSSESYQSTVLDVNNVKLFNGSFTITVTDGRCEFHTNNIPNHDFNDGDQSFPNPVAEQNKVVTITATPQFAATTTPITLTTDNAILLNGVKVDLLAAACYGVGDEKTGCNNINQPWRFDPMFKANGFKVDSHNAHTQPDGSYHYHGKPNAMYEQDNPTAASPVVGFAADGFPIFGPYIDDNGTIRKVFSSYRLKQGNRPSGNGNPGGVYDGTFRDDYEYIAGDGDLDECNGMTVNGVYGYYITDGFPYILSCFKGTPDPSFNK